MRVVVAPARFEGSLGAGQAAVAIQTGLRRARPDAEVVRVPVGDGGTGTLEALVAAGFRPVPAAGTRPTRPPGAPACSTATAPTCRPAGRPCSGWPGSTARGWTRAWPGCG